MTEGDLEDDVPWASPEIERSYEVALGRFMLAFNRLDNLLTETVETVLNRLGRQDLVKNCTRVNFSLKLLFLDLLKASTEGAGIENVPIELIKRIAAERNVLAHGHFDQNPFDGSYQIVIKNVRGHYPVERLNGLTEEAIQACDALRHSQAIYEFSNRPTDIPEN